MALQKIKIKFINSVKEDFLLFEKVKKYSKQYATGQDNFSEFLGNLKNKVYALKNNADATILADDVKLIIKEEYRQRKEELKKEMKQIKKEWAIIEPLFLKECQKNFDGHSFPEGHYTAIMSIWNRFDKDLKRKTFSFPVNQKIRLLVIIHELLHFQFYDYFYKNFKNTLNDKKVWELSEILNVIVMNKEPYITWVKVPTLPYPAHEAHYKLLKKIYKQSATMKEFIERAILLLNK